MQACVQYAGKLVTAHLPPLMNHAWQLFLNSQPLYQHLVINNSSDSELHEVTCLSSHHTTWLAHAVMCCELISAHQDYPLSVHSTNTCGSSHSLGWFHAVLSLSANHHNPQLTETCTCSNVLYNVRGVTSGLARQPSVWMLGKYTHATAKLLLGASRTCECSTVAGLHLLG